MKESRETVALREEVRAWLEASWRPDMPVREFRERLLESGYGVPTWPKEAFGLGVSNDMARVIAQEFARAGAPGFAGGMARGLAGPTIAEHGTDEQRRRLLPPALLGDVVWCQLFSEPGAGSDLASVTTTAVRHGDEFIVNGQKVWTSGAQRADMGMLVCRTDWDVPKHQGISWIAFPMRQEGVDVRPLRQMTGGASFCEVFITDARASADAVIGGVNNGWKSALTTLAHERGGAVYPGVDPARARARQAQSDEERARARARMMPSMIELARRVGKNTDPVMRQELVKHWMHGEVTRLNNDRARAARAAGKPPGPEGSLAKLALAHQSRLSREVGLALLGAAGMLAGADAPLNGAIQVQALSGVSNAIWGGTDQVQRNILGERILGLPKEPSVDTDVPFREVKTSGRTA